MEANIAQIFVSLNSWSSFAVLGLLSGLLTIYAFIPYVIDTAARSTQPQRASWLIWSVLGIIAFFSQLYEGAGFSLWFAGVQVSGTLLVFALSIWCGAGCYLKKSDYAVLIAAAVGLCLWYFTENAGYALLVTISISLLGGSVTVIKAFRDPESETMTTWVVSLLASACALISVGKVDLILMAYPLYLLTLCTAIVLAMLLGKYVQREIAIRIRVDSDLVDIHL